MNDYVPKHSNEEPFEAQRSDNGNNESRVKKILWYIILAVTAALLTASVVVLVVNYFGSRTDFNKYKNEVTSNSSSVELPDNPIDFKAAQAQNPDVCAWIQVDGIDVIDYPILQSDLNNDDNFYLDHDVNGKKQRAGAIYIQKANDNKFTDPNTVIYGHNMLNGTMFGQLKKFRNREFFEQNRKIHIYTPGHILEYEIVSAFVYDDRHILNSFNFSIPQERTDFFSQCVNPTSLVRQVASGMSLTAGDKIITLSTCTSNDSERYLVVGKLIGDTKTK